MSRKPRPSPTSEQQLILDDGRERPGEGRLIEAAAGSGKTSTLEMLASERRDPCLYVAFNRAIRQEAAKRFPSHVEALTAHGAAYRATNMRSPAMQARLTGGRIYPDMVPKLVRLPRCRLPDDAVGYVVLETVRNFCNSADLHLGEVHLALDPQEHPDIREAALAGARALWQRLYNRDDTVPITHDVYLKAWQLGEARIPNVDWALFDEAQDASPVMVDVMQRQGIPVTFVGDEHQSIYQFRKAVNAMRTMPGKVFHLTRSFRFGDAVAGLANDVLHAKAASLRPSWRIQGSPGIPSALAHVDPTERHAFLSRTNVEWVAEALRHPGSIHVLGGIDETMKLLEGAYGLWRNRVRAKSVPALARFESWSALCDFAERFSDRELSFCRKLVEQYKDRLPSALASLRARHVENEDDATLVLSTAHKAKGREFDQVRLGDGFAGPGDPGWDEMTDAAREAELNLLYVALTRARLVLQPCRAALACSAIARGEEPVQGSMAAWMALPKPETRPIAVTGSSEASPAKAARGKAKATSQKASRADHVWTSEVDDALLAGLEAGESPKTLAARMGVPMAAIEVRMAVLHAPGHDPHVARAVLAAFAPPERALRPVHRETLRERSDGMARTLASLDFPEEPPPAPRFP